VTSGVAQFTYTRSRDEWKLYWKRRDEKWHPWDPAENTGSLARVPPRQERPTPRVPRLRPSKPRFRFDV